MGVFFLGHFETPYQRSKGESAHGKCQQFFVKTDDIFVKASMPDVESEGIEAGFEDNLLIMKTGEKE
jgi:hypothetical protein